MARVLLVEDEPNIASIIIFKLQREAHEVRWEPTAGAVLDAADAMQPDLILLDSSLPDGDAFELLGALAPKRPVVMMTEFRDTRTPDRARQAGAEVAARGASADDDDLHFRSPSAAAT